MWLFTKVGFFSVVRAPKTPGHLQVRARFRDDLVALKKAYLPTLTRIVSTPERDYQFRSFVKKEAFAKALASMVLDIDYDNFKSKVAQDRGSETAHLYSQVWMTMADGSQNQEDANGRIDDLSEVWSEQTSERVR